MSSRTTTTTTSGASLPSFVGQYRRPMSDPTPKRTTDCRDAIAHKKLKRFFKCTKFNLKTGAKSDQCFVTRNTSQDFRDHLMKRHPKQTFCCVYCNPNPNKTYDKEVVVYSSQDLIQHMVDEHRHRVYQCNLCLYRAISADHVNLHQQITHRDIYDKTVSTGRQLNGKSCQIIECFRVRGDSNGSRKLDTPSGHFDTHRTDRLNHKSPLDGHYQCLYCEFTHESKGNVIEHCCQRHPDYHILYYTSKKDAQTTEEPSPTGAHWDWSEFDIFKTTETQVNRVTSTDKANGAAERREPANGGQLDDYIDANTFKKKTYTSNVQTSQQKQMSGLSSRHLNKDDMPTHIGRGAHGAAKYAQPIGKPVRKSMPLSKTPAFLQQKAEMERRLELKARPVKQYESSDEDEDRASKAIDRKGSNSTDTSDRDPVAKKPIPKPIGRENRPSKPLVCRLCVGNVRVVQNGGGGAHLAMFHPQLKGKADKGNAFFCGFCRKFLAYRDVEVRAHQKSCSQKVDTPRNMCLMLLVPEALKTESKLKPPMKPKSDSTPKPLTAQSVSKPSTVPTMKTSSSDKKRKFSPKGLIPLSDSDSDSELNRPFTSRASAPAARGVRSPEPKRQKLSTSQPPRPKSPVPQRQKSYDTAPPVKRKSVSFKPITVNRFYATKSADHRNRSSSDSVKTYQSSDSDDNDTIDGPPPQRKTTTIERADPDSDDDVHPVVHYVCLFCDIITSDWGEAYDHLLTHFDAIHKHVDDVSEGQVLRDWCRDFLKAQSEHFHELTATDDESPGRSPYKYFCPVCERIASARDTTAKPFERYYLLKSHVYQHSMWSSVVCVKCRDNKKHNHSLPNNDYDIARHLNAEHYDEFTASKCEPIRELMGNKAKNGFTGAQRRALIDQKFIELNRNEVLDGHIESCLKQIMADHEETLAVEHRVLPVRLGVHRLPPLNFDDHQMVRRYIHDVCPPSEATAPPPKLNGTGSQEPEVLTLSSDSDDNDSGIDAKRKSKKKRPVRRRLQLLSDSEPEEEQEVIPCPPPVGAPNARLQCSECRHLCENKREFQDHVRHSHPLKSVSFTLI